jgi:hypothetical protein
MGVTVAQQLRELSLKSTQIKQQTMYKMLYAARDGEPWCTMPLGYMGHVQLAASMAVPTIGLCVCSEQHATPGL